MERKSSVNPFLAKFDTISLVSDSSFQDAGELNSKVEYYSRKRLSENDRENDLGETDSRESFFASCEYFQEERANHFAETQEDCMKQEEQRRDDLGECDSEASFVSCCEYFQEEIANPSAEVQQQQDSMEQEEKRIRSATPEICEYIERMIIECMEEVLSNILLKGRQVHWAEKLTDEFVISPLPSPSPPPNRWRSVQSLHSPLETVQQQDSMEQEEERIRSATPESCEYIEHPMEEVLSNILLKGRKVHWAEKLTDEFEISPLSSPSSSPPPNRWRSVQSLHSPSEKASLWKRFRRYCRKFCCCCSSQVY